MRPLASRVWLGISLAAPMPYKPHNYCTTRYVAPTPCSLLVLVHTIHMYTHWDNTTVLYMQHTSSLQIYRSRGLFLVLTSISTPATDTFILHFILNIILVPVLFCKFLQYLSQLERCHNSSVQDMASCRLSFTGLLNSEEWTENSGSSLFVFWCRT